MTTLLESLSRNISFSAISYFFIAVLGIVRSALLTKSLGVELFGILILILNFISVYYLLFSLKINDIAYKVLSDYDLKQEIHEYSVSFILFALSLLQGLFLYLIAVFFYDFAWINIFQTEPYSDEVKLYLLAIPLMSLEGFYTVILRLKNMYLSILIPRILGVLASVLIIIYFAFIGDLNITTAIIAFLTMFIIQTFLPLIIILHKAVKNNFNASYLREGFRSWSLIWSSAKSAIIGTSFGNYLKILFNPGDIILLGALTSPTQVGIYGFAKTLASPIQSIGSVLQTVYTPIVTSLLEKNNVTSIKDLLVKNILLFACSFFGYLLIFILVGSEIILYVSSKDFFASLGPFYLLIAASSLTFMTGNIIYPIILVRDKLFWLNFIYICSITIIIFIFNIFYIDALLFASAQFILAFLSFIFHCWVWKTLNKTT